MHATANLPIENCDSIFLLFPNNDTQTTCYYQPYLSGCRLSMGEFGVKPAQYVRTYNDSRFVGLTLDALNLEMSKISAMNKDFSNSIADRLFTVYIRLSLAGKSYRCSHRTLPRANSACRRVRSSLWRTHLGPLRLPVIPDSHSRHNHMNHFRDLPPGHTKPL